MKKFNYLLAGLLATAAFTACSNEDVADGKQTENVNDFYMTMSFKGQAGSGVSSRTAQQPDKEDGTAEESAITTGTLYLYNGKRLVFSRAIESSDWLENGGVTGADKTTRPIKISVNTVTAGTQYHAYFLANDNNVGDPISSEGIYTSETGGADKAVDNKFVMFNQNDNTSKADIYTVTFAEENKAESTPAKVLVGSTEAPIKLDRVVARIDAPTVKATTIKDGAQTAGTNAITKVEYVGYALANLQNVTKIQQDWNDDYSKLETPSANFYLPVSAYGTTTEAKGTFAKAEKNYVFENTTTNTANATTMYFKFVATMGDGNKDFTDNTFYRYDGKLYTSLQAIIDDKTVSNPFGSTSVETLLGKGTDDQPALNKTSDGKCGATDDQLSKFREAYHIEVYKGGEMYYKYYIQDSHYSKTDPANYTILRNSIYKITVNALTDLGTDVPNGNTDDKKPNYYLQVGVDVNPWVLNNIGIEL